MDRQFSHPNLLIHHGFSTPVNRRYDYDTPYNIDRWATEKSRTAAARVCVEALPSWGTLASVPYRLERHRDRLRRDAAGRAVYGGARLNRKFSLRGGAK